MRARRSEEAFTRSILPFWNQENASSSQRWKTLAKVFQQLFIIVCSWDPIIAGFMENFLRFKARKWRRQFVFLQRRQGGLAARSGTEFTWSPQLRNLAEGDWAPIFLQNKYGGERRHGMTMSFCSVLSFPASKHHEKVFINGIFGHQKAWCMNSSRVTSLFVTRHLGKFISYF